MRRRLLIIAGALVCVATAALLVHAFFAPTVLRVAVGPVGSPDVRVIVGYLQAFQRERASVRLKLVMTENAPASAKALDDGKADLAITRADISLPANAGTVAILRRDSVFFITRPGSGITRIADLKGRKVGFLAPGRANERMLVNILSHHDVTHAEVQRVALTMPELVQSAQDGALDAIFLVNPVVDRGVRMLLQAFPRNDETGAGLLTVSEADAFVEQNPTYDTYEIVRGALGANPALPDMNVTTLGVSHRLFARRDLSEPVVSELTRLLVTLRLQVAQEVPMANQLELPSTDDRAAKLPTHPGTIAYVEGETRTFFERYGDFIYIGIMAFSLLGSALAALFSALIGRKPQIAPDERLKDLLRLTQSVTEAASVEEIAWIEAESRDVMGDLIASLGEKDVDAGRIATISFLASEFRHALSERRTALHLHAAE